MAKFNLVLPVCFSVFNVSIRILETNFEAPRGAKIANTKKGRDRCQDWLFPPDNTGYIQIKIRQRNIDAYPPIVVVH